MSRMVRAGWVSGFVVVALVFATGWARSASDEPFVLLVPESYRVVQFGADINALCKVPLLAYDKGEQGMRLHSWSPSQQAWRPMHAADLRSLAVSGQLGVSLLVGRNKDLPPDLTAALAGTPVVRIDTLKLAQIANALDEHLHFSNKQWRHLARAHDLVLQDVNSERRRFGRYGRPEGMPPPPPIREPAPAGSDVEVMQPMASGIETVVIEEPIEQQIPEIPEISEPDVDALAAEMEQAVPLEPVEKGVQISVKPPASVPSVPEAKPAPAPEAAVEAAQPDPDGPFGPKLPAEK